MIEAVVLRRGEMRNAVRTAGVRVSDMPRTEVEAIVKAGVMNFVGISCLLE